MPNPITLLIPVVLMLVVFNSCGKEKGPCGLIECLHGGVCIDGTCECPPSTSGQFCEVAMSIQQRLNSGLENPIQLIASGVKQEDILGKRYKGGLIFYINTGESSIADFDGMGLVVADEIIEEQFIWGCQGVDSQIDNVETGDEFGEYIVSDGSGIGFGQINSNNLLSSFCNDLATSAVKYCDNYIKDGYSDWFLPSIQELELICFNIERGEIGIGDESYWSSTEVDTTNAWYRSSIECDVWSGHKGASQRVHPVRKF